MTVDTNEIDVVVDDININVIMNSITTANHVAAGAKFYFDGAGSNTYLMYNPTTEKFEVWVKGVKQKEWGKVEGGDPFA